MPYKNPEDAKANRRKSYAKNKDSDRAKQLVAKYDLTLEEYDALWHAQLGVCAICQEPEIGKLLAVDHDHETGRVRGLLCARCNTALGLFKDSPRNLRLAFHYLTGSMEV